MSSLAYGASVQVFPEARADVLLLMMPRSGSGVVVHENTSTRMDAQHFSLVDVRRVRSVHFSPEFDSLVLRIRFARFELWLEDVLGTSCKRELKFDSGIDIAGPAWEAWAPVAAALSAMHRSTPGACPRPAIEALEAMAVSTLMLCQPNSYREDLLRPRQQLAPRHVRLAEEFIRGNLDRSLSVPELARHVGVGVRTLFDGFRRFRDTTPAAYMRELRLEAVRRDLLSGSEPVSQVAQRWGFHHSGYFAAQYRQQFGENPLQTRSLGPGRAR